MNALSLGNSAMSWVLWNSAGAAVIVLLVLAAQVFLKDRISARWRYNLWLLVVVRLVLPAMPAARLHVPQWTKVEPRPIQVASSPTVSTPVDSPAPYGLKSTPQINLPADLHIVDIASISTGAMDSPITAPPADPHAVRTSHSPVRVDRPSHLRAATRIDLNAALICLWLTGAAAMFLRLAWMSMRLTVATRSYKPICDPVVTALVANCSQLVGVRRIPKVLAAPPGFGPALVGMWSPKLLLPRCVLKDFAERDLRLILLHELAHLKRRDVAANYLLAILQAVHWFNPLLWFAFSRMRADRELACDEAVLRLTPLRECRAYGCTILKLLEVLCRGGAPAGAVGVIQHKALMHRRIAMIAQFDGNKRRWSATGAMLSLLLVGAAAVSAVRAQQAPPAQTTPPAPTPNEQAVDQARQAIEAAGGNADPAQIAPPPANVPPPVSVTPATPTPADRLPTQPPSADAPPLVPTPAAVPQPAGPAVMLGDKAPNVPDGSIRTVEDPSAMQANAKTAEKLRKPQQAQFDGVPLRDVLAFLADAGGIDVVIDDQALTAASIDSGSIQVAMHVHDARPLDQVLQLALRLANSNLDYSLVNGVVLVSTRPELSRHVVTRAYGIGTEGDRAELTNLILNTLGHDRGIQLAYFGDKLLVTASEPSQREVSKLLAMLGDQVSKPRRVGERNNASSMNARGQLAAQNSLDGLSESCSDVINKIRTLAEHAVALSNKFGSNSPQVAEVAKRIDLLGSDLARLADQLTDEGRDAEAAKLRAEMDQIKAILAPLRSQPELTAPAPAK